MKILFKKNIREEKKKVVYKHITKGKAAPRAKKLKIKKQSEMKKKETKKKMLLLYVEASRIVLKYSGLESRQVIGGRKKEG